MHAHQKGYLLALAGAIFWAIEIIIERFILNGGESVYAVLFWSMVIQLPFWSILFTKHHKEFIHAPKTNKLLLLCMGLISSVGVSLAEYFALKYTPAVNYSFLIRTVVLFTILFAYIFLGEKLTKSKILLVIVIILGSYLLTTNGTHLSFTKGDLFTLLEAILIAIGNNVLGKAATQRLSSNVSASANFLIGVLPIIVIAAINHAIYIPHALIFIILLATCSLLISISRFYAYQHTSASAVTMVFSFTPVLVAFLAIPLLKESMSVVQFAGGFLIIAAGLVIAKLKI